MYCIYLVCCLYPNWISRDSLLLTICLSVYTRSLIQAYLLHFGYAANYLAIIGVSSSITYLLNKLPKRLQLKYSIPISVVLFYLIAQHSYFYFTLLLPLVSTALLYYMAQKVWESEQPLTQIDDLLALFIVAFIGAN